MKGKKLQLLFLKSKKLMIAAALLALFVVGETFAWVNLGLSIDNKLEAHTTDVQIVEDFNQKSDTEVTKKVRFTNNGSSDVFLRMSYDEYWEYEDTSSTPSKTFILPNTKPDGTDLATKVFTDEFKSLWEDGGDGWYYYKKVLSSKKTTEDVLASVKFENYGSSDSEYYKYKDATYHLYFTVEAVQASTGTGTLNSEEVNENATKEIFGRIAAIGSDGVTVTWKEVSGS